MYRITFSDGYKLRLTWDYIDEEASELGSYSGGTHWGQGGIVYGDKNFMMFLDQEIQMILLKLIGGLIKRGR